MTGRRSLVVRTKMPVPEPVLLPGGATYCASRRAANNLSWEIVGIAGFNCAFENVAKIVTKKRNWICIDRMVRLLNRTFGAHRETQSLKPSVSVTHTNS